MRPALAGGLPLLYRWLLPLMLFSAFLTQTKIFPWMRNNVGPFEVLGALVLGAFFLFHRRVGLPLTLHPVTRVALAILVAGLLSQPSLPPHHVKYGAIQTAILLFLFLFLAGMHNLFLHYGVHPLYLLRVIALSVLVVGPWVIWEGVSSAGDIQAAGPFRNRAHMGSYMLTAFWLVLLLVLWPRRPRRELLIAYPALALTLYGVAVSGRRSVYLSLIFGLVGLAVGFLAAHRGKRLALARAGAFALAFLALFYVFGATFVPQAEFFQRRVGMIGQRLSSAFASEQEVSGEESFFVLQRQGVKMAFNERPIFGIGWGGFMKSRYSPTGHEVHSTPLRFLAELGLVGITLYALLIGLLLYGSLRLFLRMRQTPLGGVYLALAVALWSLTVSYAYNRHITERTFWVLLLAFLVLESFATALLRTGATTSPRRPRGRRTAPPAARSALPARGG